MVSISLSKVHGKLPKELLTWKKLLIADHCWSVASFVEVSKETEVYGLDSLVADFGGMLSLFLGVSFMTIWHLVLALLAKLNFTCMWNK